MKRRVTSAGGVVLRGCRHPRVLLITLKGGRVWALPKGQVEPGERYPDTARREVREETGARARVRAPLGSIRYHFTVREDGRHVRVTKTVHYFLMDYRGGRLRPQVEEVDGVAWVPVEDALSRLTYDNERVILKKGLSRWRKLCAKP